MPDWMPEGNVPLSSDDELRSLAKYVSLLVASNGNKPSKFPEGCIPLPGDDIDRLSIKAAILRGE